jgi:adenylate kinase
VKPNLKTYVVCSGLLYGEGEGILKHYFMQARLQNPPKLPIFGKGRNRIPTVHVADLVTYVEKIVERKPNLPYLLALDHNPKPTQRKIIESISKGIGTGLVESVP